MSAATLILASGARRKMSEYGWFMFHESSYDSGWDKHSNHKAFIKQAEREEKFWAESMARFTDKSAEFWLKNGVGIDSYFTPEQLLKMGVVDELF